MGTGHVMRMIALGQAWQTLGGTVHFIGQTAPLTDRLNAEGFSVTELDAPHPAPDDARTLLDATRENDWIAIDGYHFATAYQQAIRAGGRRTLVLDDFHDRGGYDADILLNQNPDGPRYPYDVPGTALLLGTKYTLLRKEFHRSNQRETPEAATNVLVTLGGADPQNVTGKVLSAIEESSMPGLTVRVVAGAANPNLPELRKRIKALPFACELLTAVNDMPSLMRWADLAVSAAGTTSWELCFFGVPFIAIEIADNQKGVIRELDRHGAALSLDSTASLRDIATEFKRLVKDRASRQAMREAGTRLVDGKGAIRVAKAMYNADIRLRPADPDDCDRLLEWRNAPDTRANSFTTEEIPLETHRAWFRKKLDDQNCLFFIAVDGDTPVGQIRFDREGDAAVVSLSVAPTLMSRGIGTIMTRLGCLEMHRQWPGTTALALALVKLDNPASAAMFAKAGFTRKDTVDDHFEFTWPGSNNEE